MILCLGPCDCSPNRRGAVATGPSHVSPNGIYVFTHGSIQKNGKMEMERRGSPQSANDYSVYYNVLYNGKEYPPKVIVSYANYFANGKELDRGKFQGGIGTECFEILQANGFKITEKKSSKNLKNKTNGTLLKTT